MDVDLIMRHFPMLIKILSLMTSSNWNIIYLTEPLWKESTCHRWIRLTKANDAELWSFLWSASERMVEQTVETPVIWDAIVLIMASL